MIIRLLRSAMPRTTLLITFLGVTAISGCLTPTDMQNRWGYVCTDGYEFTATYARNEKSVVLTDADQEFSLKNLRVASGARYSDGSIDLWTKSAHAFIQIDGKMAHPDCTGSQL
jgi:membrane-bound inhibitor of C-type lysozyme